MRRRGTPPRFRSEADLCAAFAAEAKRLGWRVYPETSGFDLVLVAAVDDLRFESGYPSPSGDARSRADEVVQVGVQAKLRASVAVIHQALDYIGGARRTRFGLPRQRKRGPSYVAVLVPMREQEFQAVCNELGIAAVAPRVLSDYEEQHGYSAWSSRLNEDLTEFHHQFSEPLWLPPVVPEMAAGVPSPSPLSPWKVAALRVCRLIRERGYATSADFKALGLSPSYFTQRLMRADGKCGRLTRYVPREKPLHNNTKWPDEEWPLLARQIAEADRIPDAAAVTSSVVGSTATYAASVPAEVPGNKEVVVTGGVPSNTKTGSSEASEGSGARLETAGPDPEPGPGLPGFLRA